MVGGRDRDRTGDPLLAKQGKIQSKSLLRLRLLISNVLRLLQSCSKNSKSWARSLWMLGEFSDRYASEGADTLLHFSQRRFNLLPLPCAPHAHSGWCPPESSCSIGAIIVTRLLYQEPFWVSAAALANHRMKRTSRLPIAES
jgi:hypothetical protein